MGPPHRRLPRGRFASAHLRDQRGWSVAWRQAGDLHYPKARSRLDDFIRIWHEDHKAVAIETQSTVGYIRNTVVKRLTPDAPGWDGIVEETFPTEALTDPHAFFAATSAEEYDANMARMLESVNRFIDADPLEATQMSEYYLG